MHTIRVGVLRGGPSDEYDVSLQTGATVLKHIPQSKYSVRDILIDKQGIWHVAGVPTLPHEALNHVDVVFNALHGYYGEDGKVQHILETHNIPFTGSTSIPSSIGMNKVMSKEVFKNAGIKSPLYKVVTISSLNEDEIYSLFKTFTLPFIVKPASSGSSVGVSVVKDFESFPLALEKAFQYDDSVLVEEYISGREATCGVIDGYRDHDIYALPPIEIRTPKGHFFDFDLKYKGGIEEIVPGNFTEAEKKELEKVAKEAHKALGLRHYSRSDFIIHPRRGIFILETNTLPGLTESSLIPKALHAVGAPLHHFIDHILELALQRK